MTHCTIQAARTLAGGPPFRVFSLDGNMRMDDTTPVRHRRGTGFAFPGGRPFRF